VAGDIESEFTPRSQDALKGLEEARARRASAMPHPTGRDVGVQVGLLVDMFTVALWGPRGLDPVSGEVLRPLADAPAALPGTPRLNPQNNLVTELVSDRIGSVRNHLETLALALRAAAPLESVLALSRVAIEPAIHVAYLTDDVDEPTRVARAFNIRQKAFEEELADAEYWGFNEGEDESHQEVLDEQSSLNQAAEADGLRVTVKKIRGQLQHRLEPNEPPVMMRKAALGDELGELAWRVLSSAAHSQPRSFLRIPLGSPGLPQGGHSEWMGLFWVNIAVEASINALEGATRYLGGHTLNPIHAERVRFVSRDAARMITNEADRVALVRAILPTRQSAWVRFRDRTTALCREGVSAAGRTREALRRRRRP